MPNIPYSPVPSVAASGQGTPFMRVPGAVEEASGVDVGRAIQGLGHEVSKAGDMLAQHAMGLQALVNEAEAKEADIAFDVKAGEAKDRFNSMKGLNAVDARKGYIDELQAIRQESLSSMKNQMSRKMLDQAVTRRMGFLIIEGNSRAATEAREAALTASELRKANAERGINYGDPFNVKVNEDILKSETDYLLDMKGIRDPVARQEIHAAERSKTILHYLNAWADKDPETAKRVLEENKDVLDNDTLGKAQSIVNRGMSNTQTRIISDEIFQKLKITPESAEGKLGEALEEAKKYTAKYGKDNPMFGDALEQRLKVRFNTEIAAHRDQQHGDMNTLALFIGGKTRDDRITSMDALLGPTADPQMSETFKKLTGQNQNLVSKWISANAHGNFEMSGEMQGKYLTLRGKFNDPANWQELYEQGPDAIMREKLPHREQTTLLNKWLEIGKKPQTYNNIVDNSIREPGITIMVAPIKATQGDSKTKREIWANFRGALEDAQRDWVDTHKTPARGKDLEKMVSAILIKQKEGFFSQGHTFSPSADIPPALKAQAISDLKANGIKEPSAAQIARHYAYVKYKEAFQKPAPTAPAETHKSTRGFAGGTP